MNYFAEYPSPLGMLLIICEEDALTGVWMNREFPSDALPGTDHPVIQKTCQWLNDYFRGEEPDFDVPMKLSGTVFQQRVWNRLLEIPIGQTCTYGQIARELEAALGKRMSAQAVGGAVGRNPISILIPCHRVVGTGGKLTGYAGGLKNKAWLLRHEKWEGMKEHDDK